MAWIELIRSGSDAVLSSLQLDSALEVPYGGTGLTGVTSSYFLSGDGTNPLHQVAPNGTGDVVLTDGATVTDFTATGSFTGSFTGDGSGLTGINTDANFNINGVLFDEGTHTSGITFKSGSVDSGFQFSASFSGTDFFLHIDAPQNLDTDGGPTFNSLTTTTTVDVGSSLTIGTVGAGSTEDMLVLSGGGAVQQRTFSSLLSDNNVIDGSGTANRVTFWQDANTLTDDADMTFSTANNELSISGSTFGHNTVIGGDLQVLGDVFSADVQNILIEDRFALFNSGSASGDGGIIVQTEATADGVALGWDDSEGRFGVQVNTKLAHNATAIAPDGYLSTVITGTGASAFEQKTGNIRVDGGEVYIWV